MKKKPTISFGMLIATVIIFAGSPDLYAGGGVPNPWGLQTATGTSWTGTLVIHGQIADFPSLPDGLPADSYPQNSLTQQDHVVKLKFFVRLAGKKPPSYTFSGSGKDIDGKNLFYALGDWASGRLGEALNRFLIEKVCPNLPGYTKTCALTGLVEGQNNVEDQFTVDGFGRPTALKVETPLFYNAVITVVTN
jgi:hypothetical protein